MPEYMTVYLAWVYDVKTNATVLSVGFRDYGVRTKGITFMLACRFNRDWLVMYYRRMKNSSNGFSKTFLTSRDRKAAALVIAVATAVAVCYIPIVSFSLVTVFVPDFYIGGKYFLYFKESWALAFLSGIINSSSNIIIYYHMRFKFKETFLKLFGRKVVNMK
ncbi:growth hormone secretagogue receptor type 1 [Biomphalaria pfeifferi]|uniref:Growth hormone secretagogue receptor type 1 n=1 Tax=Biomphalaria pfeifferi TaxID=112525 RepID=A0AAD8B3X3_BIOPF|nr:growth hormone secretagogue receptor type 1 [Biomphalaria pfeifferi]